jgi:hypothetical protein
VDNGTVERICVDIDKGCEIRFPWPADSEFSLLSSPVLTTLVGRLLLPAGDPAPPGPVEPGLLPSPTRFFMRSSNFWRSCSARAGDGDMSCGKLELAPLKASEEVYTSLELPMLCRLAETSRVRSSLCLLSSASLAFFARISSFLVCMLAMSAHVVVHEGLI